MRLCGQTCPRAAVPVAATIHVATSYSYYVYGLRGYFYVSGTTVRQRRWDGRLAPERSVRREGGEQNGKGPASSCPGLAREGAGGKLADVAPFCTAAV